MGVLFVPNISNAQQGDVVGFISASQGDNIVSRKGKHLKSTSGMKIYEQDIFITRPDSRMQLELRDKTTISLGVSSKLSVRKFEYDTSKDNEFQKVLLHSELGVFRVISGDISVLNEEGFVIKTRNGVINADDEYVKINVESIQHKPDLIASLKGNLGVENFDGDRLGLSAGEFIAIDFSKALEDKQYYTQANMPGAKDYTLKEGEINTRKETSLDEQDKVAQTKIKRRYDEDISLYFRAKTAEELLAEQNLNIGLPDGYYKLDTSKGDNLFVFKYKVSDATIADYSFAWNALAKVYTTYIPVGGVNQLITFSGRVVGKMADGEDVLGQFKFNIDIERRRIDLDSYYSFLSQKNKKFWKVEVTSGNEFANINIKADRASSDVSGITLESSTISLRGLDEKTAKAVGGKFVLKDESGNIATTVYGGIAGLESSPNFNKVEEANY